MAGFLINARGTLLAVDPLLQDFDVPVLIDFPLQAADVPRLDGILVTHADNDHFSVPTCTALAEVTQRFHSTHYVSDLMHELGMPADGHGIGDAFSVGGVRVTVTPADHAWQNAAPKPGQRTFHDEDSCGFWIETLDGVIWAPGDSRLIREHHLTMPTPDALLFDFVHGEVSGARIQVRNTERGSAIRTTSTNDEHGPGFAGRLTQLPGRNPLSSREPPPP